MAVALTAVLALAISSAACATVWQLWRDPPRLKLEPTSDGLKWRGGGYAARLIVKDAALEQLVIWRRKD